MIFYGGWRIFPPGRLSLEANLHVSSPEFRRITNRITIDALLNQQYWILLDALRHLVLPVSILAVTGSATLVRVMRSSMLETLRQDYVRTARAKGLREAFVIKKHARRNALIPVITLAPLTLVGLLNGVLIVELVFGYPGLGRWGATAAPQLDTAAVTAFALFNALLLVLGNLGADILHAWVNPQIRLG